MASRTAVPLARPKAAQRIQRLRCPNRDACPAQLVGRLVHFASRGAADIEGIGTETAAALVRAGLVWTPADLFNLDARALAGVGHFASTSAEALVRRIRERRKIRLDRLLYALGMPGVGGAAARSLAREFKSLAELRQAGPTRLRRVAGVGPKTAEAIHAFFAEAANRQLLDALGRPAKTRA
jgi:DNA ligase (NAD+)